MIVAWGVIPASATLHALTSLNTGGSVITACNGRWSVTESYSVFPVDAPPLDRRCSLCEACWVEQSLLEHPLTELVTATFSRVGHATRQYMDSLKRFSPSDAKGFEQWLGPCAHGQSPITRCAECAPESK